MAKFRCINILCERQNSGLTFEVQKVRWKFNEQTGKMDEHNILCDFCNEKAEYIEEKREGDINVFFANFRAKSPEQRKEVIKKRAKEHNRAKMKDRIPEVRKRLLGL